MSSLEIKNLYDVEVYQSIVQRVNNLSESSTAEWGTMTPAQMLAHCAEIQEVCNGKKLTSTPFFLKLLKGIIKKVVLNDKPYRKNSPTHPQYVKNNPHDFETEKKRFLEAIEKFEQDEEKNTPHPFFGEMTANQRGWSMYKHHAHHFDQFGV